MERLIYLLKIETTYPKMRTSSTRVTRSFSSQPPVTTSTLTALQITSEWTKKVKYLSISQYLFRFK